MLIYFRILFIFGVFLIVFGAVTYYALPAGWHNVMPTTYSTAKLEKVSDASIMQNQQRCFSNLDVTEFNELRLSCISSRDGLTGLHTEC